MYRSDIVVRGIDAAFGSMVAGRGVSAVLELAILGLLNEASVHGYELRKQLRLRLGGFRVFSYGSVYPALRRLTRAGLIVEEAEPAEADTTWSRRARRVYRITA